MSLGGYDNFIILSKKLIAGLAGEVVIIIRTIIIITFIMRKFRKMLKCA